MHRTLEFITATSSGLVELVFTYVIDRYTSGNELEPNMTTRAVVYNLAENICQILINPASFGEQHRLGWLSACSDGGIQMSSSLQASVYNGFDLCTVCLVEGFRISR